MRDCSPTSGRRSQVHIRVLIPRPVRRSWRVVGPCLLAPRLLRTVNRVWELGQAEERNVVSDSANRRLCRARGKYERERGYWRLL